MKCSHCNSEWNTSPQVSQLLKNCPFCGKPVASIKMETANTLESVLRQLSSDYGLEPLRNGSQMVGYFIDLAPDLKREYRMLKYLVEAGGHTALFNARNAGSEDRRLSMEHTVRKLVREFVVAEDAARLVCEAYLAAVTGSSMHAKTAKPDHLENTPQIDPSNPLSFILPIAQEGDETAQYELAKAFYYGRDIEKNYRQAVYWFTAAAKQHHPEAMNYLGICFENGRGVAQDYGKAASWYLKASDNGSSSGTYNLGRCYLTGSGVSQDTVEAASWLYMAAIEGNFLAEYEFAELYYKGEGIRKDYNLAIKWYQKSVERGNPLAKNRLGECYLYGRGVAKDHKRAVEFFSEVAISTPLAAYNLGYCYENGLGVPKNLTNAIIWYKKAANGIDTEASNLANQRLGILKIR